jgi:septum formation protein
MEPIILASSSPRRQEILTKLGIPFRVIMPEIDEKIPENLEPEVVAELFATKKVEAVMRTIPSGQIVPWIFGADTIIVLNGKVYGKPENQEQAAEFLNEFSGKEQTVISAMALFNGKLNYLSTRINKTKVRFSKMSEQEIEWYVNTGEWHGAAGGYRIQGMASCFIEYIEGSYSSIIGLPIFEFYDILKEQGYSILE